MSAPATGSTSPPPAPSVTVAAPVTPLRSADTLHAPNSNSTPARNTRSRTASPAVTPKSPDLSQALDKLSLAEPSASVLPIGVSPLAPILPACAESSTTGLIYDPRCLLHEANYSHVEKPARVAESMKRLIASGVYGRCIHLESRIATDKEIEMSHPKTHIDKIDESEQFEYGPPEVDSETEGDTTLYPDCKFLDSDTYVNRYSARAARLSIGGLIDLIEAVLAGRVKNGFAVVRPPGHHAHAVKASGFCLFNSVAVAAEVIRATHAEQVKKIIIVDWDVHHGDGTQSLFYDNPNVLYFSIHRYQSGAFYPYTGSAKETGDETRAPGSNINVPLNFQHLGDEEYMDAFKTILLPVIGEFAPDLILVSAGFDCAQGDPLGGMDVSTEGFAHLTRMLMNSMPHGRVVMALEGGYNVRAVSDAIHACTSTLLGDPLPDLTNPHEFMGKRELVKIQQRKELFRRDLIDCVKIQKKYWRCFDKITIPNETNNNTPNDTPNVTIAAPKTTTETTNANKK